MDSITPTFEKVIKTMIDNSLINLHTAMPAIVESFDPIKKEISAVPAIKRKLSSGEVNDLPLIENIPICYPQSSSALISFPLKKGDSVMLIFSERSLDLWKSKGGKVNPNDVRKHDLSDAVAIPGVFSKNKGLPAHAENLVIQHNDATINMSPDNKFSIGNNSQELLTILSDLLTALSEAKTNTMLGPQPLFNFTTYLQLKANLSEIKI